MIDIVCLKWGTKYSAEYVNCLYAGIKRNTTVDFRFHCFTEDSTDIDPGVVIQPLPDLHLDGWWNKLYLFSEQLPFEPDAPILYFDLDTLIVNNIDHILQHPVKQCVALTNWTTARCEINSSIMMWRHGVMNHVWTQFIHNPQGAIRTTTDGDQEYTARYLPADTEYFQTLFPNQLFSYKQSCRNGLPESAHIVCYHGTPSIEQSFRKRIYNHDGVWEPQQWPIQYWRTDG